MRDDADSEVGEPEQTEDCVTLLYMGMDHVCETGESYLFEQDIEDEETGEVTRVRVTIEPVLEGESVEDQPQH